MRWVRFGIWEETEDFGSSFTLPGDLVKIVPRDWTGGPKFAIEFALIKLYPRSH